MCEALLRGLLDGGWAKAAELAVVEVVAERRAVLSERFPGLTIGATVGGAGVDATEGAVVATKPADVPQACAALGPVGVGRVLSIAAGVTIASLERSLPAGTTVVRAMPNMPALVGAGVSAIAPGTAADDAALDWAEGILGAVGDVVRVAEPLLDAVTGLSGSGPAYVFLVAEAMVEAGVLAGLPRDVSSRLALGTILGAGRLLTESGDGPEVLRAAVTSPGGTTAAGLRALESAGVRGAFLDAVMAATERSRQLGG